MNIFEVYKYCTQIQILSSRDTSARPRGRSTAAEHMSTASYDDFVQFSCKMRKEKKK